MIDIRAKLEAMAKEPRTWRVTTHYDDGSESHYDARNRAAAENFAIGQRRKIGRALISRETGKPRTATSVTISKID